MLQEEKLVSFTSTHYPRNSKVLAKTFGDRMKQAINLASSGTTIPVSANSSIFGEYGSNTVAIGTPAQLVSNPQGNALFSDWNTVNFDLVNSGSIIQKYVTNSLTLQDGAGYDSSTSTSYKAGSNTAATYSEVNVDYNGAYTVTYTGSYANDKVCLNGNNDATCVNGFDFFVYDSFVSPMLTTQFGSIGFGPTVTGTTGFVTAMKNAGSITNN